MHGLQLSIASATHKIENQPPPLIDYNAWSTDQVLREAVMREGGNWIATRAHELGALIGSARMQELARLANDNPPVLRRYNAQGQRIDCIEYHPAYHELMALAFGAGLHSLAWTCAQSGAFVARAALNYLWNQGENGTACPVTMTFASIQVLRTAAPLAAEWEPKILAQDYDPRSLPLAAKRAATIGMAMTEKQGGSDLRANTSIAITAEQNWHVLSGHKWFCSAPMSDGFLTLAQRDEGLSCFLVPRMLPEGQRNRILFQRLKDKLGNRSNACSEIEYDNALAWLVGEPGQGIATLIEMAHLTRFDIVVAVAGSMRAALRQAMHHALNRRAFGRLLAEQSLMQNVLADLALECEAATLLAFRLARAFDRMQSDAHEKIMTRLLTPIAKYWLCKRLPPFVAEALECLGGNGYVEDWPLARLYREAPLNGVWEGSGNVICLDVLRALRKLPGAIEALEAELAGGNDARFARFAAHAIAQARSVSSEAEARCVTENLALALQAGLLIRHAPAAVADAFCVSRLDGDGGSAFGTLSTRCDIQSVFHRAQAAH